MVKPPLNVTVVWHPGFVGQEAGEAVADLFYKTLSHQPRKVLSPSLGIPLDIRTSKMVNGQAPVPRPLDLDNAEHTVVLLLIDLSLTLDLAWVEYARAIADMALGEKGASNAPRHRVLPLSFIQPGLAPDLGATQAISLPEDQPPGRRMVMLQLRVMAEICRLLNKMPRGGDQDLRLSPEPLQLFLSHAKFDGETDAKELLARIEETPLQAFFDAKHIASGYDFSDEIRGQIRRSAVIAIQSDAYASRPWCRREILEAKRHERPIVVVHRRDLGEDRSFPYLGNVPTIGWNGQNHFEIIAATVREYLRKVYTRGRFEFMEEFDPPQIPKGARHLFRPPELIDGVLFRRRSTASPAQVEKAAAAEEAAVEAGVPQGEEPKQLVIYPDPPLGMEELETLADFFPEITFYTPTTIASGGRVLKDRKVALSISSSQELDELSFIQSHHLITAMSEVARLVIALGGEIAYGGDLRPSAAGGLTDELFTLVRAYKRADILPEAMVSNYLAWPDPLELAKDREKHASLLRVARFPDVPVSIALVKKFNFDPSRPIPGELEHAPYVRARCLTEMRRKMTDEAHARVVMGGKVFGHSGKYPGILEEVHLAIEAGKPVYLLGAFGGCAGLVIRAIRGERVAEFDRDEQVKNSRMIDGRSAYARLIDLYERYKGEPEVGDGPVDYRRIGADLNAAKIEGLHNGLSRSENEELFDTQDMDRINHLLVKGLTTAIGSG